MPHPLDSLLTTPVSERARVQREILDAPPSVDSVRAWWAGLPEASRQTLESTTPLAIGNLNGIPWPARIRANHRTLGDLLSEEASPQLTQRLRLILRANGLGVIPERLDHLRTRLQELHTGSGFFTRNELPRFLIGCDPERSSIIEYLGHSIRDTDDPYASPFAEETRSVGLFVPGNDSDLLEFEGKAHTMSEAVYLAYGRTGENSAGMIVWQGGVFPHGPQVLFADRARQLSKPLARFGNSIPRSPSTALVGFGFSFGGAVLGLALRRGLELDRVVHIASAGLGHGMKRLEQLPQRSRVPHFAMLAPGDATVGPVQGLNAHLPFLGRLGHGASPVSTRGITRVETGWMDANAPGNRLLCGHMTLLERWGTTAKHALAALLAGGTIQIAPARSGWWRLAERLALPISPITARDYVPVRIEVPAPQPRIAAHTAGSEDSAAEAGS